MLDTSNNDGPSSGSHCICLRRRLGELEQGQPARLTLTLSPEEATFLTNTLSLLITYCGSQFLVHTALHNTPNVGVCFKQGESWPRTR